jgi:hypothetical protein
VNSNVKLIAGNPNANEMEPAGWVHIFGVNMTESPNPISFSKTSTTARSAYLSAAIGFSERGAQIQPSEAPKLQIA